MLEVAEVGGDEADLRAVHEARRQAAPKVLTIAGASSLSTPA
jgi:hypothetical protein